MLWCSCDQKLLALGWQETTPWEEGLRKTIDWYLKFAKREYWCASECFYVLSTAGCWGGQLPLVPAA